MTVEEKLKELHLSLPEPKNPVGAYTASRITGKLLFISGQISIDKDGNLIKGKIGKDLDVLQGYEAAKRCGLAIISQVQKSCEGDLSRVKSCIKLTGYVNSSDDFTDQPKIINGASEIVSKIFDGKELHTRVAISANSLPLGVAVEVDALFELN
jgi:enamine deaminase RidA (YjgF/YER057c/UK114 family)